MDKIRICFIVGTLRQGGAERQLVELIKNINKIKYEITLFVFSEKKIFYNNELRNTEIIFISRDWKCNKTFFRYFECYFVLKQFLHRKQFDILHTTLFYNGAVLRLLAPKRYNNKIISGIRNSFQIYPRCKIIIEKYFIKQSYVVANTKQAAIDFQNVVNVRFRNKIRYIYNGYSILDKYEKKSYDYVANRPLKIIMVGRITTQKNQIQVLHVLKNYFKNSFTIHIYGAMGNEYENIIKFIKDHNLEKSVVLKGSVNNIKECYKKYDLFILSSLYEGCPNALFEAMIAKIPVIINDNSNTDGFIVDFKNGFVFDNSDRGLKNTIQNFITLSNTSPNTIKQILYEASKYTTQNFSVEAMVKSYENLYCNIYKNNDT